MKKAIMVTALTRAFAKSVSIITVSMLAFSLFPQISLAAPPGAPSTPSGPTAGLVNQGYSYSVNVPSDPDGGSVKVKIAWGDGSYSESGFMNPGSTYITSKAWAAAGTYMVAALAIDQQNEISPWSLSLSVAISADTAGSAAPDLVVNDYGYSYPLSSGPVAGDSVGFSGKVKNEGGASAVASSARLRLDVSNDGTWDVIPNHVSVPSLAAGASYDLAWPDMWRWTAIAGTHRFEICADATSVVSEASEINNCVTRTFTVASSTGETGAPHPPSNLRPDPLPTTTTIYLKWTDNATNEDKFNVERSSAGANTWTFLAQPGANTVSYADSNVSTGTVYDYRVQACLSGSGCSVYAYLYGVSTSGTPGTFESIPTAPSHLSATLVNNNLDVRLAWSDNSGNETEFKIYRRPLGGTFQWISSVGTNITSFSEFGFASSFPAGTYEFKVQACNSSGCSVDSNIASVVVAAQVISGDTTPPALVSGPTVSNVTSSSATISWSVNEPAFPKVFYGTSTAFGNVAISSQTTLSESQTVSLTGLSVGTDYWYQIKSCDASGNCFMGSTLHAFKTLAEAGSATISGTVRDPSGSPLANIVVAAGDTQIRYEAATNASGVYQLTVAAGTWNVGVKTQREGYFNPPITSIAVTAGTTRSGVDFQYQSDTTGVTVTGTVRLFGEPALAHVWAREGLNRFKDAGTDPSGNFSLVLLPNLEWHIGAGAYRNGVCYRAAPIAVTPQAGTTVILDLVAIACPDTLEQQHNVQQDYEAKLNDGTSVTAPVGAFGTSGTVTVTVAPDTTAPETPDSSVIGVAYRIEARKSDGTLIEALNEPVRLSLPYSDEALVARGITAQNLQMAFFDEVQKRWARISEATLDDIAKRMRADVTHLTRFALVSAADTVPPPSPTGVTVKRAGSGALNIHWVNPAVDFHHVKVYRSTTQGQQGELILSNYPGSSWRDAGLENGVLYYYNVKAVDPAGNVSTVDAQTSHTPSAIIEGGLREGDLIRGPDGIKVYIVSAHGFKRHIFNPAVFGMYRHFSWGSIKSVSQDILDSFITSDLYRAANDFKVYSLLELNEAQGLAQKRWFDLTPQQFTARFFQWEQVFEVNAQERDYYQEGTPIR